MKCGEQAGNQRWQGRRDLSTHNEVLWIKGKPGAGMSTLMKHSLEYFQNAFQNHVIAACFFNARGDRLEKSSLGMLRSLSYQLVDQNPLLYELFRPKFRDKQKKHLQLESTEGELRSILLSALKMPLFKPVFLLIDALDECNEQEVRKVVDFLETLSIKFHAYR